jgi:uncharacterized SAM-dependent methyltransferase
LWCACARDTADAEAQATRRAAQYELLRKVRHKHVRIRFVASDISRIIQAKETKLLQTIDKLKIKAMRLPCHCNIFCLVFFDMFSLTTDSDGIRIEHICA